MKKILLPLTGIVLMLANADVKAGTQLDFTATVVQSCTLSMSSSPLTVTMGKYPTSYFSHSGIQSPYKSFGIHISGCANSRIALKWTGNADNAAGTGLGPYTLAVDGAKGLGIRVTNLDTNLLSGFSIPLNPDVFITMPANGAYDFNMAAFYVSYQDSVIAGSANASATVEVTYG